MVNRHEKSNFWNLKLFGSGHFLVHFLDVMDQKMPGSKKFVITKNQFFHARQQRKEFFEICS